MRNGDSISRRSGWRVVSLPFLLNCFLFPQCQEMKLLCTHFCNKHTVPLLLNPCIPGFRHQMLWVATSGFMKGTPSWFTHILLAKRLHKNMLLLVAVHSHSIRKNEVPPYCELTVHDILYISVLQMRPSKTVSPEEKTTTPWQKVFCDQVLKIRKLWKWKIYTDRSWVRGHPESREMLGANRLATGCHNPKYLKKYMFVRYPSYH